MSRVVSTEFYCDLSERNTVPAIQTDVAIGYLGQWYQVDIGEDALRIIKDLMNTIIANGRKVPGEQISRPKAKYPTGTAKALATEHNFRIRTWARANGWPDMAPRGVIPRAVIKAYNAAKPEDAMP
jgi:hypothetical protein